MKPGPSASPEALGTTAPSGAPPEGVATQAPPGITCVLLMGAFFTTAWGLRVLFSRLNAAQT